jgi:transposase InsO family protein
MAVFKFGLIAPVIQNTFEEATATAYYRRVCEKEHILPDGRKVFYRPKTLEAWTADYKKNGIDALLPKIRNDKGESRKLSEEAKKRIFEIKEEFPKLNANQIHLKLQEEGLYDEEISVRTVQRYIKVQNLKGTFVPTEQKKDRKAFEYKSFGDLWQADTCYICHLTENGESRQVYLVSIIDDHTRMCVFSQLSYEDTAFNFQNALKSAISIYGIPRLIYVDNGSPYKNNQISYICASIGSVIIRIPVRYGASKGKVERSFRTYKERWLYGIDLKTFHSLDELTDSLNEYTRKHNNLVNSSIGTTPMNRFMASADKIRKPKSIEWLEECFMNRMTRKVRNDATVRIDNKSYDVPKQFIGNTVEVRFTPDSMENAYIFCEDVHYPLKLTNRNVNAHTKRDNKFSVDYSTLYEGVQDV